jgi:hypothetical protein
VLSQPLAPLLCITDSCSRPWGGSLGCVNHPGNLYPLKGVVWPGGPSRRWVQGRCRLLSSLIIAASVSSSSEVGILTNKLVMLGVRHCLHNTIFI